MKQITSKKCKYLKIVYSIVLNTHVSFCVVKYMKKLVENIRICEMWTKKQIVIVKRELTNYNNSMHM